MKNSWGRIVPAFVALALVMAGCSGSEPQGIPDSWEQGNWSGPTGGLEWLVDDGQSYVVVSQEELRYTYQGTLLTGTEDERAAVLVAFAAEAFGIRSAEPDTEPVDLDGDGVAIRFVGDALAPGQQTVFVQLTGSATVWVLSAWPLQGEVDPYFLRHFVPEFDPATLPAPVPYEGDSLFGG